MKLRFLAAAAAIGMLAAMPAYATDYRTALLASALWNGVTSSFVSSFYDAKACETAFAAWQADGLAKIKQFRPGITGAGLLPVFWHTCSPLNSPAS